MEDRKESKGRLAVPEFGDWDLKHGVPDYSMDFSTIRENRKQNKNDFSHISVGNEDELVSHRRHDSFDGPSGDSHDSHRPGHHTNPSPTKRRNILSYFNCFISA